MDLTIVQGTLASLKIAGEIAQGLLKLNTMSEVQGKVIELQSSILAAQTNALSSNAEQAALVAKVRELEEEVARVKAWESQKQRYSLQSIWEGAAVVYALKESVSESEPPHWICTKCYEDGFRMILQPRVNKGLPVLACPQCKCEAQARYPDEHTIATYAK